MKHFLYTSLLLVCTLLSGCHTARPIADKPPTTVAIPPPSAPAVDTTTTAKAAPLVTPPALPVKPTRREYKAYKRQLNAWQKSHQAYASALKAPSKIKVRGTGATATSVQAAPNAVVTTAHTQQVEAPKLKNSTLVKGDGNTVAPPKEKSNFPWWAVILAAVVYIVWRLLARVKTPYVPGLQWNYLVIAVLVAIVLAVVHFS